jgi:hypothetical protein
MRHDRHPLAPDNIENCQRVGLIELGNVSPRRPSNCGEDRASAFSKRDAGVVGYQRHTGIHVDFLRYTAKQVDATVFENEPRPCNQITNCFRYKGFTGLGYCRNSRRDMNCNTADLVALQVDLTNMNTATH